MPAQVKYRSESHVLWHTAPRCRRQAYALDGLRTSSLIGFFHMQNNSAAHVSEVRSHLEVAIHSLPVLHAKGEVFKLMPSGCCCATRRGQKGPAPTISHLTFPPQHLSFQYKWAEKTLELHIQVYTPLQLAWEEKTQPSPEFL